MIIEKINNNISYSKKQAGEIHFTDIEKKKINEYLITITTTTNNIHYMLDFWC